MMLGTIEVIPSPTVTVFWRKLETCVVHTNFWIELLQMTWEKLKNVALLSLHEEHNFCSSLGDV